jgi:transcriptional regulator with XRE-family HTH domain
VILSPQGWQKLMQARVLNDKFGNRYTYEQLSERAGLDERTVSRLLSCEVKVDKRTLKTFFRAFDLPLEAGDCNSPKSDGSAATTLDTATHAVPNKQMLTLDHLVEELIQLKQRVRDYERLFHRFGLNESYLSQQEA